MSTEFELKQKYDFIYDESDRVFWDIFYRLKNGGRIVSPRGQKVLEVENFSYELPPFVRFCNFTCRKLKLSYIKQEFLWYLRGDPQDKEILKHSSMWGGLVNVDGSINSNYGQYVFGDINHFDDVVRTLEEDKDSRRASVTILSTKHLKMETKDVPCTYALNFRIRENKLNMSVHMRSQDAIFGMGNDAPAFSFIHEMVCCALRRKYPDLQLGNYHHIADSFHVYERHFSMLDEIVGGHQKRSLYMNVFCPEISSPEEVDFLRAGDFSSVPEGFKFSKWLNEGL